MQVDPGGVIESVGVLARELRHLKGLAGLSLSQLADRCWCSKSSLERYLNGRTFPPRDVVKAISEACGGDTDHVLALWEQAWTTRDERGRATAASPGGGAAPVAVPPPKQLPLDVRSFTGRAELIASLDALRAERDEPSADFARVAVIVGTAGVGKTALATHWAHRIADRFPDGQLWINLQGYAPEQSLTPDHALGVLLRALGVAGSSLPPDLEGRAGLFRSLMANRRALLVLDNAASAEQVRPLLPGGAGCLVLATSRDSMTGLVARDGATRLRVNLLSESESVALLRRVVGPRAVDAHADGMRTLVRLCARLPLALRIVADHLDGADSAAVTALIADLAEMSPLDTMTVGGDTLSAIRTVFSWSYRSLPADAAALFRRLSTLPLPDYDDYVAAAMMGTSLGEVRRLLAVLADAHLVESRGAGHLHIHDLLRAFAAERAQAEDTRTARGLAVGRVLNHYCHVVADAVGVTFPHEKHRPDVPDPGTPAPSFPDAETALSWLDNGWGRLLAATTHAATAGWSRHAIRLAAMLYRYLIVGAHHGDALIVHGHAVDAAEAIRDRAGLATAAHNLGSTFWLLGRQTQAHDHYQRALDIFVELGDHLGEARALGNLGNVYWRWGRNDDAYRCYQQAQAVFVEARNVPAQATTLLNLGELHNGWGQYEIAFRHGRQALDLYRSVDDLAGEASARKVIGDVHFRYGRSSDALGEYETALDVGRRLGHSRVTAYALDGQGSVWVRRRQYDRAVTLHEEALSVRRAAGDVFGEVDTTDRLGFALYDSGDYGGAVTHYRTALTSAKRLGWRGVEPRLLNGLGEVASATAAPDSALLHHEEALDLARRLGDRYEQARGWFGLAVSNLLMGNERVAAEQGDISRTMYGRLRVPESADVATWLRQLGNDRRNDVG